MPFYRLPPEKQTGTPPEPPKCKNCKFWGEKKDWFDTQDGIDVRFCQHPMVCRPTYGKGPQKTMTASGVLTMDEGGCTGELCTGPDFMCRHFKSAEVTPQSTKPNPDAKG